MSTFNPPTAMIDRRRLAALRTAEDRKFARCTQRSKLLHLPMVCRCPDVWSLSDAAGPRQRGNGAFFSDETVTILISTFAI